MSKLLLDHFSGVEDPRILGMVRYPLEEILLTVVVGFLCRADDVDEIVYTCEDMLDWLREYGSFINGIAPAQTILRVLARLDPRRLEEVFALWMRSLGGGHRAAIAIDGKTLRGSKTDANGAGALHLVQAFAHEAGLVLAQSATAAKSNEISAIPEVLKLLELEGCIVTIDAMGAQREIATQIVKQKGDYVLALKGNQGTLHDDAAHWFGDAALAQSGTTCATTDLDHGRIEERSVHACDAGWLAARHPGWAKLRSVIAVTLHQTAKKTGKTSTQTRYFISSLPPDAAAIAPAIRGHWSIENTLHWTLDVTFGEDHARARKDHSARNLANLRRAALNMLKADTITKTVRRKRHKALVSPDYRAKLLAVND